MDLIFLNHTDVFRNPQTKRMSHLSTSISHYSVGFHYDHKHRRVSLHHRTLLQLRRLVPHASKLEYGRQQDLSFPYTRLELHNTNLHWQREEAVPAVLSKGSADPKGVGGRSGERDIYLEERCRI